jgi:hypothetical protein
VECYTYIMGPMTKAKTVKNPDAVRLGRLGGLAGGAKGGNARAAKLSPAERSEAAKNAVSARWKDHVKKARPLRTRKRA